MDITAVIEFIVNNGFAIAVAIYSLTTLSKKIEQQNETLIKLQAAIDSLQRYIERIDDERNG